MKILLALILGIAVSVPANGTEAVVARHEGIGGYFNGTAGWTFQTTTNLTVTALGNFALLLYDGQATLQIGLWNSQGELLASSIVTTNSPLTGQSRYESIEPVFLYPQEIYHIGAYSGDHPTIIIGHSVEYGLITTAPEVLLRGQAGAFGGFLMPLERHGADGAALIGPNFQFTTIPEPATWHVLLGGLAAGFFIRRLGRRNT